MFMQQNKYKILLCVSSENRGDDNVFHTSSAQRFLGDSYSLDSFFNKLDCKMLYACTDCFLTYKQVW